MCLTLCQRNPLDGNCRSTTHPYPPGLFKELARNAEAKDAVAEALKQQQATDAASAKFV